MKEFVGVKHLLGISDTAWIKQEALMFDRVAVVDYHKIAPMLRQGACPRTYDYYDDLDWLLEQGVIFEPENIIPTESLLVENTALRECLSDYLKHVEEVSKLPALLKAGIEGNEEAIQSAGSSLFLVCYYQTRQIALMLREVEHMDAYPIFTLPCGHSPVESSVATKNEVVEISLNKLPMPDYSTSWEQILEYRSDPNSKIKFTRLRQWMSKVARVENKPNEVEEEIEALIDDYSQHMKFHKIKTRLDTLKTILVAEAGLFTGGWLTGIGAWPGLLGMVANPIYAIRRRQIDITAEELKAPSREVAYIVDSHESFPAHKVDSEEEICDQCGGGTWN